MTPLPVLSDPPSFERADPIADLLARFERARARREPWVPLWRECYDYTLPGQSALSSGFVSGRAGDDLFDGTAPDAVDQLAASLLGHLTPPWVGWFGFAPGIDLSPAQRVAAQPVLDQSTTVLQHHVEASNLAVELHQCFLDLVIGGTACLMIQETLPGSVSAFACKAVPLSELILEEGPSGRLENVYRLRQVPAAQAGLEEENSDVKVPVLEFVRPDPAGGPGYEVGTIRMADGAVPAALLASRIVAASPYIAFRWATSPGQVYGRSPVMKALPDIKTANKVVELILKNASIAATGIWQADDDGVINPATIELVPGAIIPKAVGSQGLKALDMPGRFDVSQLVLSDLRVRIRHALLVDHLSPQQGGRMTATEVLERSDATAFLLGATYGRLQSELLTPLVQRLYAILRRRGEVADLPLDGRVVSLVHRSPLARIQARQGLQPVMTWLEGVRALPADAALALNAPEIVRHLAGLLGVPEALLAPEIPVSLPLDVLPSDERSSSHDH